MFDAESLAKLDGDYFNVIVTDGRDVTIQSKNTGHYWYLHCTEYPTEEACVIFHKHSYSQPYHQHGYSRTLLQAVKSIKSHDTWQLKGRPVESVKKALKKKYTLDNTNIRSYN